MFKGNLSRPIRRSIVNDNDFVIRVMQLLKTLQALPDCTASIECAYDYGGPRPGTVGGKRDFGKRMPHRR